MSSHINADTGKWSHKEDDLSGKEVVVVQADEDELMFILEHFKNIPLCTHKRVMRWHGDIASFIANHL